MYVFLEKLRLRGACIPSADFAKAFLGVGQGVKNVLKTPQKSHGFL
jgi:hypothetical protein